MKRTVRSIAVLAVLSIAVAACGNGGGEDGGTTAAACSAGKLKGYALGAPSVGNTFTAAGSIRELTAQAKPVVKIGLFGDLTGANSNLVAHIRDGAALAVEQANAAGTLKVTVEFVPKDNKDAKPDTAPAIEQAFIDDEEVVGVVGGAFSGETLAVGNLFDAAGLTHVSPSATNPEITTKGWPFFRALSTDEVQGAKVADLAKALGCTKIAVIDDKTDYGKGLADFVDVNAKKIGLEVVSREGVEQKTADYGPLVDTLIARSPDVIFYGGYYNDGSLLLKQAREKGLKALFMCGDGCKDPGLVDGAGAANAEGAVLTCPCLDPNVATDDASKKFAADYQTKYGKPVGIYGAEGYDAASILLAAIDAADEDGKVTRPEIFDFVDKLENFKGLSKTFTFDEKGEVSGGAIIAYAVKGGKLIQIGQTDQAV